MLGLQSVRFSHQLPQGPDFACSVGRRKWVESNGGPLGTMDCFLALHPAAPGSTLGVGKNFSLDAVKIYRPNCLEQWAEA